MRRGSGGVDLQMVRDWVVALGNARGLDGLVDGKSPGDTLEAQRQIHHRALAEVR